MRRARDTSTAGRARAWLAALCAVLALPLPAHADGFWGWTYASSSDALALSMPADGILLASSFALWESSQAVRGAIGPKVCNLCGGVDNFGLPTTPGNGRGSLNAVDAFFHDEMTGWLMARKTADNISGVIAYVAAPVSGLAAAALFTGPHAGDWAGARAMVLVLESISVTGLLGQSIKFGLARKRPWVRYGHGVDGENEIDGKNYNVNDPDKNFSLFSGHASATAAGTVSAAMCATLQDSSAAPYLWAGAGTLVFVTGSLRLISETHYFTDVVGGSLLGAGVGVLVPLLHRAGGLLGRDRDDGLQVSAGGETRLLVTWNGKF